MTRKPVTQALVSLAVVALVCVLLLTGCTPLETVTAPPGQTSPALSSEKVIKDLACIRIQTLGYNDDADPQTDGIALDVMFYASKDKYITFRDIPVTVTIELYAYREVLDAFHHEKMEFVYQQQVTVDHSMRLSEMGGKYIRIPFENIMVDQNKYYKFGTIKVTVAAPKQGDFQDMQDLVRLYPEE